LSWCAPARDKDVGDEPRRRGSNEQNCSEKDPESATSRGSPLAAFCHAMNPATNPIRPSAAAARSLLPTIGPKDIPPPDGLQLDLVNWWRFVAAEVDALLAGEDLAIWRVVSSLWPTLRKPRFWCDGQHQRTALPTYGEGTLIMRNVHDLTLADQEALLDWCEHHRARSRMIATAPRHLPALVESGRFNRRLYDHLQSVQLQLP
jgi:Sigma-54 interaction domain